MIGLLDRLRAASDQAKYGRLFVKAMPADVSDELLRRVLAGEAAAAITAALQHVRVQDGYRLRPLHTSDVEAARAFVRECRLVLAQRQREADAAIARRDALATLLGATP